MKVNEQSLVSKPKKNTKVLALAFIAVGASVLLSRDTLGDYASGLSANDGIYIPDANYKLAERDAKGGIYSHTFRIYNLRPRKLNVKAEPDCGCTNVSWSNATIPPFGWKEITAQMKVGKPSSVGVGFHSDSVRQPWTFAFLKS